MKRIDMDLLEVDHTEYVKRTALVTDVNKIVREDVTIFVDDEPVLVYKVLPKDKLKHLRWAVKNVKYGTGERTLGLKTTSKVFGYSPRLTVRHDFCRLSGMGFDEKKQHKVITDFGKELVKEYKQFMPEKYEYHENMVNDKVLDEWRISETPFTSGIVNKNNQLKYHYDAGNFKGVLSNMIVLKKDVEGGYLVVPALDMAFEVCDGALVIFNGQNLLHGVSEINYTNDMGYRYSVVYYSLEQMWKCDPLDEEIARIRNVKTEREKKRLDPEHIADLKSKYENMKTND